MKTNEKEGSFYVLKRLLTYMIKNYKFSFAAVVICIITGAFATMRGMLFVQSLVDDYILPLLDSPHPDYTPLAGALAGIVGFYILGVAAAYAYNRIMVNISQGTMRKLRDRLFSNMESLPIRYFDTHAHGDIMSIYTNDVDTLRQLFGQSIPQIINSAATLAATFLSMVTLNLPLAVITVLISLVMLKVTATFTGLSGQYFQKQQSDLGNLDGYIEEMVNGQKVVKVFNHEAENMKKFSRKNEMLKKAGTGAQAYAATMVPAVVSISYINYAVVAVLGGIMAIKGLTDIGSLASYLVFVRQAAMPINQFTQQSNFLLAALAGAERIFNVMKMEPETDDGKIRLVNVKEVDGELRICKEKTNRWAWHKPDGELVPLRGDVRFKDVSFGYGDSRMILNNNDLYA